MLIKKEIILNGEGIIDYNYNYELMKRLYESLTVTDDKKALRIHDDGIKSGGKKFKLFNYTLAFDRNVKYTKEGICFNRDNDIRLILSGDTSILNGIIKGIISKQKIMLNGCELKIKSLDNDKEIKFRNVMLYKVRSPIVESIFDGNKIKYLNPCQKEWYSALGNNLKRKYKAVYNEDYTDELYFDIEDILKPKQKFITKIKKGFVIGHTNFEIFVQATPKMQKIAYNLGLGQNSSIGMGAISYIKGWDNAEDV